VHRLGTTLTSVHTHPMYWSCRRRWWRCAHISPLCFWTWSWVH